MFNRSKYTKCKECSLQGNNVIKSVGPEQPKIAFIGDAPGKYEDRDGVPFAGGIGYELTKALGQLGLARHEVVLMYVYQCKPPRCDFNGIDGQDAYSNCLEGFNKELEYLQSIGVKVLVPMGNIALKALGIDDTLSVCRGSVYCKNNFTIIPTFHPSYITRWSKEKLTWLNDLNKAIKFIDKPYEELVEDFNIFPTMDEIVEFVDDCVENNRLIGVDIETTGFNPWEGDIVVTGIAIDESKAISFPKYKQGGGEYWRNGDNLKIREQLQRLLDNCPLMFQNALFDVYWLLQKGFKVGNIKHDTLLLHHVINAELPHKLEYINSVYGKSPAWKSVYGSHKVPILNKSDEEVREYNCRDVVVLHQMLDNMIEDCPDNYHVYEQISMPLLWPILEMMLNGFKVDKKALNRWSTELSDEIEDLSYKMIELCDLPIGFNLSSSQHQIMLLFNKYPNWTKKVAEEYSEFKGNKNTKKFATLKEKADLVNGIVPFTPVKGFSGKMTTGGGISTDDDALNRLRLAAIKRLTTLHSLKRVSTTHLGEEVNIKKLLNYIQLLRKYRAVTKLFTTYTKLPIMPDGRVHTKFMIHGTANGRLSSNGPNMQNIPSSGKIMFVSDPGKILINIDHTNLELIVLAYISNDDVLQGIFRQGLNLHDVNTKKLFNIMPDNPMWKVIRRVAKTYIFGRNYGGSLLGMYKRIMNSIDDFNMSFEEFRRIDTAYFQMHPKYAEWREALIKEVLETRELTSCFGRKRIFNGNDNAIVREALNFPIQSAAADIMNKGLINIYKERVESGIEFDMLLTVHDSLVVQCNVEDVYKVIDFIKPIMEQEHLINGELVSFPTDVEVGYCYKNMIPIETFSMFGTKNGIEQLNKYCGRLKDETFLKMSIEEQVSSLIK